MPDLLDRLTQEAAISGGELIAGKVAEALEPIMDGREALQVPR
ncbi:hypothetical protein [Brucella intermedia]|nr:hypothetical protein [Brucella intermedia]